MRLRILSALTIDVYQASKSSGVDEEKMKKITEQLINDTKQFSTNNVLLNDSVGFLEELWHFIALYSEDEDKSRQEVAADTLLYYVILSHYRNRELTLLSGLYAVIGAQSLVTTTVKTNNERHKLDDERMRFIFHHPETPFYSYLKQKNEETFPLINALQPVSVYKGKECIFYFSSPKYLAPYDGYLKCNEKKKFHISPYRKREDCSRSNKFILYEHTQNGKKMFGLYSEKGKGFIVPTLKKNGKDIVGVEEGTKAKKERYLSCKSERIGDEKYGWFLEEQVGKKFALVWCTGKGSKKYLTLTEQGNYLQSSQDLYDEIKLYPYPDKSNQK